MLGTRGLGRAIGAACELFISQVSSYQIGTQYSSKIMHLFRTARDLQQRTPASIAFREVAVDGEQFRRGQIVIREEFHVAVCQMWRHS